MQMAQIIGGYSSAAPTCCAARWARRSPRRWRSSARSSAKARRRTASPQRKADEIFDLMEKFAGYGFNKSHAAAYALRRLPDRVHEGAPPGRVHGGQHVGGDGRHRQGAAASRRRACRTGSRSCRRTSTRATTASCRSTRKRIRYGLGAIKGTGEQAIGHIIAARAGAGRSRTSFDFCHRVDKRIVNRRTVESLVRAGAFDSLDDNRASLLASVGIALESAEQASRSRTQVSLFGDAGDARRAVAAACDAPRWDERERLQNEKQRLGFYLSRPSVQRPTSRSCAASRARGSPARAADRAGAARRHHPQPRASQMTRRGRMAVLMLDDGNARIEVTVFNELFTRSAPSSRKTRSSWSRQGLPRRVLRRPADHRRPGDGPGRGARRPCAAAAPVDQRPGRLGAS